MGIGEVNITTSFETDLQSTNFHIGLAIAKVALNPDIDGQKDFPPTLTPREFTATIEEFDVQGLDEDSEAVYYLISRKLMRYAEDGDFEMPSVTGSAIEPLSYKITRQGAMQVAHHVQSDETSVQELKKRAIAFGSPYHKDR